MGAFFLCLFGGGVIGDGGAWAVGVPVFDFVCEPKWGSSVEVRHWLGWVHFSAGSVVGTPSGYGDATVVGTM